MWLLLSSPCCRRRRRCWCYCCCWEREKRRWLIVDLAGVTFFVLVVHSLRMCLLWSTASASLALLMQLLLRNEIKETAVEPLAVRTFVPASKLETTLIVVSERGIWAASRRKEATINRKMRLVKEALPQKKWRAAPSRKKGSRRRGQYRRKIWTVAPNAIVRSCALNKRGKGVGRIDQTCAVLRTTAPSGKRVAISRHGRNIKTNIWTATTRSQATPSPDNENNGKVSCHTQ